MPSVREQGAWRFLYVAVVIAFFAAAFETVRRLVRLPTAAIVTTASVGLLVWARVVDSAQTCEEGSSDCYHGLGTIIALAAALAGWAVYLIGVFVARLVDRLK